MTAERQPRSGLRWPRAGLALAALGLAVLAGCERGEQPLEGERVDVRAPLVGKRAAEETANRSLPVRLARPSDLKAWTHRNGNVRHRLTNLAFSTAPARRWSVRIGEGNSRKLRLTADPVVAGGRIFVMDAAGTVSAVSTQGEIVWQRPLRPASDARQAISGGGLAVGNDALYATTGYGELHALDPATGAIRWTQKLDAPASGAPLATGGQVYVMTRNDRALALRASDGRILWTAASAAAGPVSSASAAPADAGRVVVLPFGSGELSGVLKKTGIRLWSTAVTGARNELAIGAVADITSDPVIDGARAYAGNRAGRLVALDARSGERIWTADEGSLSPAWVEGGSVFVVSDASKLVRLSARDGSTIWSVPLPRYRKIVPPRWGRPEKRVGGYAHYGPVMAGGRLWVGSGDDRLRAFDPTDGRLLAEIEVPGGVASHMAVVGGVMYFLTGKGELVAFQ